MRGVDTRNGNTLTNNEREHSGNENVALVLVPRVVAAASIVEGESAQRWLDSVAGI